MEGKLGSGALLILVLVSGAHFCPCCAVDASYNGEGLKI